MEFIDLKAQYALIEDNIKQRISDVLDHGKYILGPEVFELEEKLAEFTGVKHCVSCGNGTDALQMALMALGIGHGDEVITTSFSFFATAEVICLLGARPIFIDIDERTFNIDASLIEEKITSKTKAIIPVSLFGQCADMDEINKIASKHNLPVIEDAAQSFGATYKDRKSCNLSTIGCTSFFPSKPLGCYGDGGACFTNDDALASILRSIRVHGQGANKYDNVRIGLNSRLDTIQAAILIEKLEFFPKEIEFRQRAAKFYNQALIKHFQVPDASSSVWAQYCLLSKERESICERLRHAGIPSAIYYNKPLHKQTAFNEMTKNAVSCPIAESVSQMIFSLPMHPYLSKDDQRKIIQAVIS